MSDAIPSQHPAVVLRSNYQHLRALLAVAMIAVVGLTVAVVILATNNGGSTTARVSSPAEVSNPATPASSQAGATLDHRGLNAIPGQTTRYDGGPEEGTRGAFAAPSLQLQNRNSYNGGHEEGIAGATVK
jgi:hypothetical protein